MKLLAKKRRIENKTNYTKRRRLLESSKTRVVVRKSNKYLTLEYIESYAGQDSVKVLVVSKELVNYGWPKEQVGKLKNLSAAYLAGFLFGSKLKGKKTILDTGLIRSTKGSRVYAAVKGMIDAGLGVKCSEKVFPAKERIEKEDFFQKVKSKLGGK